MGLRRANAPAAPNAAQRRPNSFSMSTSFNST